MPAKLFCDPLTPDKVPFFHPKRNDISPQKHISTP